MNARVDTTARANETQDVPSPSASRLRVVLSLSRIEAIFQARSLLVLAGLLAGGVLVWYDVHSDQPLWWNTAWQIGSGQLILAISVLICAHLAAGRARRDGMTDLYASFPATAGLRTLSQLVGVAGAVPAGLLLIAATAAAAQAWGAIGTPSITVLAGGMLLVVAAGAVGIAIATRFPHPIAGVFGGLVLFITSMTSNVASGKGIWVLPWEWREDQLGYLPGPVPGYPPGGAHAVELAGIAVLGAAAALAMTAKGARARTGLASVGVLALAVSCFAGSLQLRPIYTADLNHLVSEVSDPASVQHCTTSRHVQYCLYPDFGVQLPALEAPVNRVLALVPALPARPLTITQAATIDLSDGALTAGHSKQELATWAAQLRRTRPPANSYRALTIDEYLGSWPAGGANLAYARFTLALGAAEWAVNIPPSLAGGYCVLSAQARGAIAMWMAIQATRPSPGQLRADLRVGIPISPLSTLAPGITLTGTLLAQEMTRLPQDKVDDILRASWSRWLNRRTSEAQLAAALGIQLPRATPVELGGQPPMCKA